MDWLRMISVEGTACCVVSAICYAAAGFGKGQTKELESAIRVSKLKDLAQLWDAASTMFPLVVAVTGFVSSDTPINCEYSGLKGAMVEIKEERHILRRNFRGEWKKESILPSSVWNEVPWYLDDGTARLRVCGARLPDEGGYRLTDKHDFPMTCGREVFEQSVQSPCREKLELDSGVKTLGVQKIERVLPIGACLTVFGEVTKDHTGTFVIQRPYQAPFHISYKSVSEIIDNCREVTSVGIYLSVAFGLVGVIFIAKHAFEYMEFREMQKREAEYKSRLLAAAAAAKQASTRKDESEGCR